MDEDVTAEEVIPAMIVTLIITIVVTEEVGEAEGTNEAEAKMIVSRGA